MRTKNNRRGIIALPIVVLLTVIIVSIAVGLSSVSYNENVNSLGIAKSSKALYYALTGARDALERISKNNAYIEQSWNDAISASNGNYKVKIDSSDCATVLDGCARVRVDYLANKGPSVITSEGVSGTYKRKIQVSALVDANGGISSVTEVEIKSLPTISTAQTYPVGSTSATLNGWVNPNGNTATTWFRYCKIGDTGCSTVPPSACNDTFGTKVNVSGTQTGYFSTNISYAIGSGLSSTTTYYYCAVGDDGGSPATKVYGNVFSFTTT